MHSRIEIRRLIAGLIALFAAALLGAGTATARERDSDSHRGARINHHNDAIGLIAAFAGGYHLAALQGHYGDRSSRQHDRRAEPILRHAKHRHGHGCGHPVSIWRSLRHQLNHSRGHGHFRHHQRHFWRGHHGHRRHHDRH